MGGGGRRRSSGGGNWPSRSLKAFLLKGRGKWAMAGLLARWWAETSVALQRANAEALLASLGEQAAADEEEEQEDRGLGEQPVTVVLLPTEG